MIGEKIMKNSKFITKFVPLFTVIIIFLFACGGESNNKADKTPDPTRKPISAMVDDVESVDMNVTAEQTWDVLTIYLPKEFDFIGGTEEDPDDVRFCTIKKTDSNYFSIEVEDDKKIIMDKYNEYKETYTNEQEDVKWKYGDITWEGFQFIDEKGHVKFAVHAKKYKKYLLILGEGFDFYSPATEAMIGSMEVEKVNESTLPGDEEDVE